MNTGFFCTSCRASFSVNGDPAKIRMCLDEGGSCPKCGAGNLSHVSSHVQGGVYTAEEFWAAINGFGMPDEVVVDLEPVVAMLLAHKVVAVDAVKTRTGRVELRSVTLDNGVTVHLTASGEGAVILKTTRRNECQP